jgi:hypothetical protein
VLDPLVSQKLSPASNTTQSFIDEQNQIEKNGGPGGNTYNKINSPVKKLRDNQNPQAGDDNESQ